MKNKANLYDIDGELLAKLDADDPQSIEVAKELVSKYQEKLKDETNKNKAGVYQTYINNLQRFIFNYYIYRPELLQNNLNVTQTQIQEAMEQLKADVDNEDYTEFEEVKESDMNDIEPVEPEVLED